jgi:hypothetical protein
VRLNWFRGFYRLWLALSLLWVVLAGTCAVYVTWEQEAFERRIAVARASDPEAAQHGGLLLTPRGAICTANAELYSWERCAVDPLPLHPPEQIGAWWLVTFGVPALFYGLLRTLAWILGGFGRTA